MVPGGVFNLYKIFLAKRVAPLLKSKYCFIETSALLILLPAGKKIPRGKS